VAVTKESPPDKGVFGGFTEEELNSAMVDVLKYQQTIVDIKAGIIEPKHCEACDYCRSTKMLKGIIKWNEVK
jgi:hypothetical protein